MRDYEKNENQLDKIELTESEEISEKQENYRFIKETIKEKPVDSRKIFLKIGGLLAGAVVFGIVAAFVFVHFVPIIQGGTQETSKIVFEEDEPMVTATPTPEPSVTQQAIETPSIPHPTETMPEITLDTYQELYNEMNAIAKEAMRSLVTVTGISSNEDWFNITTESIKQASGVIIAENDQELYILTEYRAVDMVDRIMITFHDGSMADGRYQMHDSNTGITILRVAMEDLPADSVDQIKVATLGNSYMIHQGDAVIAIGSPMGYSNSIVHGQVTSTTSTVYASDVEYNLLITNILGSTGGSGVLIDLEGNVIGLIAQAFGDANNKNIITGLPVSQLKSLISVLSNNGQIPYLGIKGQSVTAEITMQTGMPKGVYVDEVIADSPALQAGIQNADIITKYNGETIETIQQYSEKLSKSQSEDVVTITVMRKGAEGYVEFEFQAVLGTR